MNVVKPSRPTASDLHGRLHSESTSCSDVAVGVVIGSVTMVCRNHEDLSHPRSNICAWSSQGTL